MMFLPLQYSSVFDTTVSLRFQVTRLIAFVIGLRISSKVVHLCRSISWITSKPWFLIQAFNGVNLWCASGNQGTECTQHLVQSMNTRQKWYWAKPIFLQRIVQWKPIYTFRGLLEFTKRSLHVVQQKWLIDDSPQLHHWRHRIHVNIGELFGFCTNEHIYHIHQGIVQFQLWKYH